MTSPPVTEIEPRMLMMRRTLLVVVICAAVSVGVIAPFFVIGEQQGGGCCGGAMPVTHDMVMHFNQMQAFHKGLAAGHLYPRWNADTNRGFGAPTTIFYPPLTYYLTSLLFLLTGDWMAVIKAFYLIVMYGSCLSIFLLARRFLTIGPALVAACVYAVMPYHLLNHYQRGALAECLSFIWIPLALRFIVDLMSTEKRRGRRLLVQVGGLSLVWGAFVWSHPPTAYQFLLVASPLLLGLAILKKRWKSLILVGAGIVLGVALSAAYLVPAVAERSLVHSDDVEYTWPYHESYVLDLQSTRYDHRSDDFVVRLDRLWLYGVSALLALAFSLAMTTRAGASEAKYWNSRERAWHVWFLAGLWASFMMLAISGPIGRLIPQIEIGVFAWRMLATVSVALTLLLGYLAHECTRERALTHGGRRTFAAIALTVNVVALLATGFFYVVFPMYRAQAFVANPEHSNYSLVPLAGLREPPLRPEVTLINSDGQYAVERWDPEFRIVHVEMLHAGTLSFRTYNFPGWTASSDTLPLAIRTGAFGEIATDIAPGNHRITLEFKRTRIRTLGLVVSSLGIIVVAIGLGIGYWKC